MKNEWPGAANGLCCLDGIQGKGLLRRHNIFMAGIGSLYNTWCLAYVQLETVELPDALGSGTNA